MPALGSFFAVTFLTVLATLNAKDLYRSTTVAAFNRNDTTSLALQNPNSSSIDRSDWNFESRFKNPFFLQEIIRKSGIRTQGRLDKFLVDNGLRAPESESDRNARIVAYFAKRLIPTVNNTNGHLTIEVLLDDTPEKSQELAAIAMEEFINTELTNLSAQLGIKIDTLTSALNRSRERLVEIQKNLGTNSQGDRMGKEAPEESNQVSDQSPLSLRQKEIDLTDQIRAAEREFASLTDDQARQRVLVESELQRMSSRLAPNHPDRIAKEIELRRINESNELTDRSARKLSLLRREMLLLKTESALTGLGSTPDDPYASLEARIEANQIATLQQTITELNLERESLIRQAADPEFRTRIKVIKPPTYEIQPASRKQLQVALGGALVALIAGFGTIFLREATSRLVRDAWRVRKSSGLPVLAQISAKSAKNYSRITPEMADNMREKLSSNRYTDRPAIRTLLAYRKVELVLFQKCEGKVISILSAGPNDLTADFIFNLANIVATDTGRKVLVIDCKASEPIVSIKSSSMLDFIDALLGYSSPENVVIKSTEKRSFDVIAVTRAINGERTRAIQEKAVRSFLAQLESIYDLIFIRSLPESYFIENSVLIAASSDVIFGIDAANTTFFELARTLDQVEKNRIRGIVLVGT